MNVNLKSLPSGHIQYRNLRLGFFFLAFVASLCSATSAIALEKVTLQLKWLHQFQSAGFYAAKAQGYYRDAGLDVHFLEGRPDQSTIDSVVEGAADYGVNDSRLLLARSAGKPVVVLGVIFQHSPAVLLARQDAAAQNIHDLIGKRIMLEDNKGDLAAYFLSEGISNDQFTQVRPSFNLQDLIAGKVDAISAYLTNEPFFLNQSGFKYQALTPRSAGIDFYGDSLFTTEQEVKNHPERVKAFRDASFRGWKYAMAHPEEMVELILAEYSQRKTKEHLLFEAQQMAKLIQPEPVEMGYMHPGRWRHIADSYADLGILPRDFSLQGFLYQPNPKSDHTHLVILALLLALGLLITLAIVLLLRKLVQLKTEALEKTNRVLAEQSNRLTSIINGTTDAIFIKDTDGKYVVVNDEVVRLFDKPREEIIGRDNSDFFLPEESKIIMAGDRAIMADSQVITREEAVTTLGRLRVYLATKGPVYDEQGKVVGLFGISRDISESKRQEAALKASNAKFESLVANTPGNIAYVNADTLRYEYANDQFAKAFGIPPEKIVGSHAEEVLGEEKYQHALKYIAEVKAGRSTSYEYTFNLTSGKRWLQVNYSPIIDEAGQVTSFVVLSLDITERKQADELLWKEKALLRSLIDSAEDLIYFKDQNSIYRSCNKASENFTGLSEAEQVGKSDFDFFDREFAEHVVKQDQAVLVGGTPIRVEEWVETPNSDRKLLETVKAPIYGADGQPIGLVGISRDITERYLMEKTLRESEERFKQMFDKHSAMMLLIEPHSGAIIDANQAAEDFYRYSRDELLAMNINQINTLPSEAINAQRLKAAAEDSNLFIFPHKISNGEIRTVEVHSTPITINGKALLFSIIHDITDRKRAEEEKLELQQQLQQAQKLESLGVLAGGIAHDFNNILAGLYGNLSLAKRKLTKDHPDHPGFRYLDAAEKSMNRATLLSGQLLTFAKGGEPVTENLSLGNLIEEVVFFNLSGSNVRPVISLAENLWFAKADQGQIQQVFGNLTINAKHAMPDGGHLYITVKNVQVAKNGVADIDEGKYLLITVADEGTGITPENLERIFDPYFTTKQTGSGLGLATVFSIIKKHGGHVVATSQVSKGTTFTLYLPASETKKQLANNSVPNPGTFKQAAKVLVMDDDETICSTVSEMLEELNCSVVTAPEGQQALILYQQALDAGEPFDLVILDLTIPGGVGGKEVAKRLLALDPAANMVVSSGYADDPVMANYNTHGFRDVIAKPYNLPALEKVLWRVLGS